MVHQEFGDRALFLVLKGSVSLSHWQTSVIPELVAAIAVALKLCDAEWPFLRYCYESPTGVAYNTKSPCPRTRECELNPVLQGEYKVQRRFCSGRYESRVMAC